MGVILQDTCFCLLGEAVILRLYRTARHSHTFTRDGQRSEVVREECHGLNHCRFRRAVLYIPQAAPSWGVDAVHREGALAQTPREYRAYVNPHSFGRQEEAAPVRPWASSRQETSPGQPVPDESKKNRQGQEEFPQCNATLRELPPNIRVWPSRNNSWRLLGSAHAPSGSSSSRSKQVQMPQSHPAGAVPRCRIPSHIEQPRNWESAPWGAPHCQDQKVS